jgi:hypothetical protein
MEMKCKIISDDPNLKGVVIVSVPGIYGTKGNPLPKRMAKLVREAAEALNLVFQDVAQADGHLYLSDMFRSAEEQEQAHNDYLTGRKSAFSPPSCGSVHEAARAIDIDAFDTGIGHKRVRKILNKHGWVNIVDTLTGSECWHYEFRGQKWQEFHDQNGYAEMARAMKKEIGNVLNLEAAVKKEEEIKLLQTTLNKLYGLNLDVDGMLGPKTRDAVRRFQAEHGLQVDGVPGPITKQKLKEATG